jgi:hypothetical protein
MALTQTFNQVDINGRKVFLPAQETNLINSRQAPIAITPYIVISGVVDVTSTLQQVYAITVPVPTYIISISINPSSSDVSFILFYGDYSIGNTINNAVSTTSIAVDFPSPFFPLIPSGAVIQLVAVSSSTGQTIEFALQGMQMQVMSSI